MNTNEVCKKLNITLKSLIFYEDYGIVVPKREKNNYRNYSEDDLLKLRELIAEGSTNGVGDSITLSETGIIDLLI